MAITTAMCTSFKKELLEGLHNFRSAGGHVFNVALYTSAANLDAATTAYGAAGEVTGAGYTAKGNALMHVDPVIVGTTAFTDFADTSWPSASFSARGCLIFNDSVSGDPAVSVHDFGSEKVVTNGTFTLQFPAADAASAIIRIA